MPFVEGNPICRVSGSIKGSRYTAKYKEFIVTSNTKTHHIRPLVMKISSSCQKKITVIKKQRNEHADYLVSSFDEGARAQNHSLQRLDFFL